MMITYAIAIIVVLALCGLGMSIGLILRGRSLQTCGRAAEAAHAHGHEIECASCSGKSGECKREKAKALLSR